MSAPKIITVIGYFSIPAANADAFRQNCEDMIGLRDKEPGHVASAYSFADGGAAVSREDYDSADAFLKHMELGAPIFEKTKSLVEITSVELHGPQDELDKLKDLLAPMSPRYFVTEFGFRT